MICSEIGKLVGKPSLPMWYSDIEIICYHVHAGVVMAYRLMWTQWKFNIINDAVTESESLFCFVDTFLQECKIHRRDVRQRYPHDSGM